jgi:KDO2-lipid IV(A) lauroyltransferase
MDDACRDALRSAGARGRGVVVATAHTGNWDLAACAAARWLAREPGVGGPLHVVTKRLRMASLDASWQRLRADRGVALVDAAGAVPRVRAALAAREVVALLIDQVPERRSGVATFPFLGAPARHDMAPAILAARARAPIVLVLGHRTSGGRHRLECHAVIDPEELHAGDGSLQRAAARLAGALERFVEEHPEQWLWLHRRWK